MLVVAVYVLAFAVLGFVIRRWLGLVLPPIVWLLLFLGPEQGWWGSDDSSETAWYALAIPFSILSMLTMTLGILLGQIYRDRTNRNRPAPDGRVEAQGE